MWAVQGVEAKTEEEEVAVIRAIMTELLRCLRDIHRTGTGSERGRGRERGREGERERGGGRELS